MEFGIWNILGYFARYQILNTCRKTCQTMPLHSPKKKEKKKKTRQTNRQLTRRQIETNKDDQNDLTHCEETK